MFAFSFAFAFSFKLVFVRGIRAAVPRVFLSAACARRAARHRQETPARRNAGDGCVRTTYLSCGKQHRPSSSSRQIKWQAARCQACLGRRVSAGGIFSTDDGGGGGGRRGKE